MFHETASHDEKHLFPWVPYFVLIRWHQGDTSAPHDDGVIKGAPEPAVIAISGIGPIHYHLTAPSKPGWREV